MSSRDPPILQIPPHLSTQSARLMHTQCGRWHPVLHFLALNSSLSNSDKLGGSPLLSNFPFTQSPVVQLLVVLVLLSITCVDCSNDDNSFVIDPFVGLVLSWIQCDLSNRPIVSCWIVSCFVLTLEHQQTVGSLPFLDGTT